MTPPSVSVVVVTRHRPSELLKCLCALRLQTYRNFEIIVVGDSGIRRVIEKVDITNGQKQCLFDQANISRARNIGVDAAGGEIVAFIDDDAVAEPTWLERLIAPFDNSKVGAAGGFTRGRNGLSYQWKGERVDRKGWSHPMDVESTQVFQPDINHPVKTHGTNCAFRKSVLIELGGFDENFRFFLEDADMNMRVAEAGHMTALVPLAEVQHGFAPSIRRRPDRAPRDLFEVAASQGYFQSKHRGGAVEIDEVVEHHRKALLLHMVRGLLEPRDVRRLSSRVQAGFIDGQQRKPESRAEFAESPEFFPLAPRIDEEHHVYYANWLDRRSAFRMATSLAEQGKSLTLMVFSKTTLFHRRWFHPSGFWVQTGGVYGKSLRGDPMFRRYYAVERADRERKLVSEVRKAVFPPLPIATQSP